MGFDLEQFIRDVMSYRRYIVETNVKGKNQDFIDSEISTVDDLLENLQIDIWLEDLKSSIK